MLPFAGVLTIAIAGVLWVAPALDDRLLCDETVGGGAVQEENIGHKLQQRHSRNGRTDIYDKSNPLLTGMTTAARATVAVGHAATAEYVPAQRFKLWRLVNNRTDMVGGCCCCPNVPPS